MKGKLFFAVIFVLICSTFVFAADSYKVLYNSEIKSDVRLPVESLTKKLIASLEKNELTQLQKLLAKEEHMGELAGSMMRVQETLRKEIGSFELKLINEYYVVAGSTVTKKTEPVTISIRPKGSEEYNLGVQVKEGQPTYVALYQTTTGMKDYLLSVIMVKEGKDWLIQWVDLGAYQYSSKDAVQWYDEAYALSEKGYFTPAMLKLSIAFALLQPAPFMQYDIQYDIFALTNHVKSNIVMGAFPLKLQSIKTKPEILGISPQFLKKDFFPSVQYVSQISLDDRAALQKEAEAMAKVLEEMFPGITKMSSHVVFNAYAETPSDSGKQYRATTLAVQGAK